MGQKTLHRIWMHRQDYLWILPAFVLILFLTLYPAIFGVTISLRQYNLLALDRPFIGLENYARFLRDPDYWYSLFLSGKFLVVTIITIVVFGLGAALLLNQKIRLRAFFRSLFMLPWVISMVATGLIFRWMFDEHTGLINYLLSLFALGKIEWLSSPSMAFWVLVIAQVWKLSPFCMIILLAGLQSIPPEYYEAASIDGANWHSKFRFITLPFIKSPILVVMVLLSLSTFNMVDLIYVVTRGGPGNATQLISYYMYKQAFEYVDMGYASSIAISLLLVNLALTRAYIKLLR